ncbi:MAG TPA: AURKAIP1/COX24 domain-containing protein [Syntrophorhabdaceae bacterium]|nr:AURKAIP1/COX24 domain-containing protein [Syntrophorhabdales bacterium]MBP9561641.1 AURKAIP1/COX24 domain-containing protein [Syntrophorhabdaceae bacterium]HOV91181.1 AURKAIP1/COX24 domain-containing protein [Syntrophorhabdaceae bacterium]
MGSVLKWRKKKIRKHKYKKLRRRTRHQRRK